MSVEISQEESNFLAQLYDRVYGAAWYVQKQLEYDGIRLTREYLAGEILTNIVQEGLEKTFYDHQNTALRGSPKMDNS